MIKNVFSFLVKKQTISITLNSLGISRVLVFRTTMFFSTCLLHALDFPDYDLNRPAARDTSIEKLINKGTFQNCSMYNDITHAAIEDDNQNFQQPQVPALSLFR